jgi:hypothetical protein
VAHQVILTASVAIIRHRAELRFVEPGAYLAIDKPNSSLLRVMVRVQQWKRRILTDEIYSKEQIANETNLNASYVGRMFRIASLGPECIDAVVLHGTVFRHPALRGSKRIPLDWKEQKTLFFRS